MAECVIDQRPSMRTIQPKGNSLFELLMFPRGASRADDRREG